MKNKSKEDIISKIFDILDKEGDIENKERLEEIISEKDGEVQIILSLIKVLKTLSDERVELIRLINEFIRKCN